MKVQRLVMAGNTQPAGRKSHLRLTGVTLKMPANLKNNGSFIAGLLGFDYTAGLFKHIDSTEIKIILDVWTRAREAGFGITRFVDTCRIKPGALWSFLNSPSLPTYFRMPLPVTAQNLKLGDNKSLLIYVNTAIYLSQLIAATPEQYPATAS